MKLPSLKGLVINYLGRQLVSQGYNAGTGFIQGLDFGYGPSDSGVSITESSALTYTAYWACVRLLSETLASLPLITYRRLQPRGKERATDLPLYSLLHDEPNPEMDSFTFRETLMAQLVTTGNCYSLIDWEDGTTIKALWIMAPDKVTVQRDQNKQIVYKYTGIDQPIPSYRVWHIPGLGYDGLIGYSPIAMARQAIGLGLATEKFGSKFFSNGAALGGYLEHPGKLSQMAHDNLLKSFKESNGGLEHAHEWKILEEGMKAQPLTIPPEDAQFLQTRQYQVIEMCRWFNVQPHMIHDLTHATFSNIEHQSLEFAVYTMRPWLVRWEQSIARKLINSNDKGIIFSEFLVDGLLRGDIASRYQAYSIARNWGWMSADDVRELENMNPLPNGEGETYMAPANMLPADQFEAQRPKPTQVPVSNNGHQPGG